MRWYVLLLFAFYAQMHCYGQRVYNTKYAKSEIKIDGELTEDLWSEGEWATDFIENYPNVGQKATRKTECKILYSDDAIYFAAKVYDDADSISYFLTQRDNFGNADYVGLTIDTYGNYLNAFAFYVTPSGVELDALVNEESFDYSWNAVWKSRVAKTDFGWQVEMRIPYMAIRFPNKEVQTWNIIFERQIRRNREVHYWNPVDPTKYGEIAQSGKMLGMRNIKPPLRLSFSPYVINSVESNYDYTQQKQVVNNRLTGGMDLKWGLNDAFTLDMTLVPDFGQTVSDQKILNLGPYEVQFAENRSFFTEGFDLFGIGGVFYSRRIGGTPFYQSKPYQNLNSEQNERVVSESARAPLLNGTKISGRTKGGLGVGFFNAIEGETYATIENGQGDQRRELTNPYTNYNVAVFSQNLVNNGRISFLNTNVTRSGEARDANVSVFNSQLFSKDRNYSVQTIYKLSDIMENGGHNLGHSFFTQVSKVQGQFNYGFSYYEESETYDPNDLGYLQSNNSRSYNLEMRWTDFKPKGRILRKFVNSNVQYRELYFPKLYSSVSVDGNAIVTFRNFMSVNVNADCYPFGYKDYFEARSFGQAVNFNPSVGYGGWISSDYSKPFALDVNVNRRDYLQDELTYSTLSVAPRFNVSNRLFLVYRAQYELYESDYGYVRPVTSMEPIILGTRNRDIVTNTVRGELVFTKRMGLNISLRHYWQRVEYLFFSELQANGDRIKSGYNPVNEDGYFVHNTSYNAFTVDLNYKWVFFPGCEFLIFFKNNIFSSIGELDENYFSTFNSLFDQPQVNSISGKILVFVDALYLRGKKKRGN
ncbi:MAG: carbohydrate binding family 9 domain-containing protein [Crocinitomicaceae bacterium]|jgi:hypothetical protein|nr:carbohydrate binding family 9 domain-containing protein [Crocinitomicaceae bacterium]